jgi:hypothetical protein
MTEGDYLAGRQSGQWTRWSAEGKVQEIHDYDKVQLAEEVQPVVPEVQVPAPVPQTLRQPRPSRIESARRNLPQQQMLRRQ